MSESQDLLARIEALEAELARLKKAEAPIETPTSVAPAASRRDLLRYGAVALGAAAATGGFGTPPAEAADGNPVLISANNSGTGITNLSTSGTYCFFAQTGVSSYSGLAGQGPEFGTYGLNGNSATTGAGVFGFAPSNTGTSDGVRGVSLSSNGVGVRGICNSGGNAVRAEIASSSGANAIAMYALNYSAYAGTSPGAGGFAIYGLSARGHGLVGATAAAGAAAVVGATNGVVGAYAAAFYGSVIVGGNFTVVGGAKSAAVPHPDGSHRRLYCVESPESWFEDYGRGALECGEALIRLDPDFAAVVDTSDYHVFLTGHDGRFDLTVGERTAEGFRVNAASEGGGTFSWRVLARRKDIPGVRFERVEVPKEPSPPPVPASALEKAAGLPDMPQDPRKRSA